MIDLQQTADGVLIPVLARAGARKNGLAGLHAGQLKISVTQAPEKGKANGAIAELLAEALAVRRSQVRLVAGATSPRKRFLVEGMTVSAVQSRIHEILAGGGL